MHMLLAEDDPMIAEAVTGALEDQGHSADLARDGETALTLARMNDYAFLLLDLGLPKKDGLDVLKTLRREGRSIPVIILTARDALEDRLSGLDAGADDYLVKPFHVSELLARMRAVERRRNGSAENKIGNGVVTLNLDTKTAEAGGKTVALSKREYDLMSALLSRPGAILSRQALEDRVYAMGEEPESNAIEYLIHSLRKKLGSKVIRNVRGLGWMTAPRE